MNPLKRFELFLSYDAAFVSKTFLTLSLALLFAIMTGETEIKTSRLLRTKIVHCHFPNWYATTSLMYLCHTFCSFKDTRRSICILCVCVCVCVCVGFNIIFKNYTWWGALDSLNRNELKPGHNNWRKTVYFRLRQGGGGGEKKEISNVLATAKPTLLMRPQIATIAYFNTWLQIACWC